MLRLRCTNGTGYGQPTLAELVEVCGLNSRFFNDVIHSWQVETDGRVHNVHVLVAADDGNRRRRRHGGRLVGSGPPTDLRCGPCAQR